MARLWRGYKVHFTETFNEECPFLICNVETTAAMIPDITMGAAIHASLKKKQLLPALHLVDSGYVEADWVLENERAEEKVEIIGPLRANVQWQAQEKQGFALTDFSIDWENKQVICPAGQVTTNWFRQTVDNEEKVRIRFRRSQCQKCVNKTLCTRSSEGRSLLFSQQSKHEWLEEKRNCAKSIEWQQQYHQRAGIEGTFSQAVRAYSFRRSRYIGKKKTHLHNLATAAAINIGRSVAWLEGKPREKTRISWFGRLRNLEL